MLWKCSTFHLTTMKNLRWIACLIYFSVNSKHDISLPYGVRSEREVFVMKINQAKQNQKCSAQRTRRRKNYKFSILASHGRWLVICAICDITFGWEYGLANVDQQWHRIVQARCATLENTVNNQSREKCGIEAWVHVINQIKTFFRMRAIFLALQFRAGWPTRSILSVFFSLHLKKAHISPGSQLWLFSSFSLCATLPIDRISCSLFDSIIFRINFSIWAKQLLSSAEQTLNHDQLTLDVSTPKRVAQKI